jgi:HSP20 family protein
MSTKFSEFDILFHNFFFPSSGFGSAATTKQPHPLNIYYDETGLHFEVACTGLTKDDVKIDIEDDILKISYDKPEDEKELHPGTIHRGLSRKSFNLGYKISSKYDLGKADGKLENGLLDNLYPYY